MSMMTLLKSTLESYSVFRLLYCRLCLLDSSSLFRKFLSKRTSLFPLNLFLNYILRFKNLEVVLGYFFSPTKADLSTMGSHQDRDGSREYALYGDQMGDARGRGQQGSM